MITPRDISYDLKTGHGIVVVDEGQSFDANEVAELFSRNDPRGRFVKVIAGQRTCAGYEKLTELSAVQRRHIARWRQAISRHVSKQRKTPFSCQVATENPRPF